MTGDQLVRLCADVRRGQTVVVSGALGGVGRAAVHSAKKLGAQVIVGVRSRQVDEARSLGAADVVAIDDDAAIGRLPPLDAVADTVGGELAAKLFARIKPGGRFGYASAFPERAAEVNPTVRVTRVFGRPDASKLREFADDVRDGLFVLPIGRRLPLQDAAAAHAAAERGGAGKIVLEIGNS
jgi:NADPH:quinone reductase-like Zn-dependent oxidoreductase